MNLIAWDDEDRASQPGIGSEIPVPGSGFDLKCSGCGRVHEILTGASYCWNHRGVVWSWEQYQCPSCQMLMSRQSDFCCREQGLTCERCGSDLEQWPGRVWLETQPDGMTGPEHVE